MFLKASLLILAVLISAQQSDAATDKVVCSYASWAGYRTGQGAFTPTNINATLCTHILYTFLGVASDGSITILDSWNEVDLGGLRNVALLKRTNPDLKVLFSIGGWNAGNALLAGVASSPALRKNFIASTLNFLLQWDYDGIDIDWVYPVNTDRANFVTLLQEVRAAFGQTYVLSITVASTALSSYDVPQITRQVDLINVMTYDYHTADEGVTGLNSPLYRSPGIDESITSWLNAGASASKLTLSIPFYGHSFWLTSASSNGIGAPATPGLSGPFTQSAGVLAYNEICAYYNDWVKVWDSTGEVPYTYDGNNWISYDDPRSVSSKTQYAVDKGLAGVTIWTIDEDDFHGVCGTANPLLNAIHRSLNTKK